MPIPLLYPQKIHPPDGQVERVTSLQRWQLRPHSNEIGHSKANLLSSHLTSGALMPSGKTNRHVVGLGLGALTVWPMSPCQRPWTLSQRHCPSRRSQRPTGSLKWKRGDLDRLRSVCRARYQNRPLPRPEERRHSSSSRPVHCAFSRRYKRRANRVLLQLLLPLMADFDPTTGQTGRGSIRGRDGKCLLARVTPAGSDIRHGRQC
ncbi:MAG: hypothetical protein ACI853_001442 [Paracoccaceae bacterium]|jgi:hypothetical protein